MNKIFLTIANFFNGLYSGKATLVVAMRLTCAFVVVVGMLTLFSSAYYSAPDDSRIGHKAPALVLGNDDNGLSPLLQHRGENVLVSFWTSADAQSRINNLKYDRLSKRDGASFVHVSVNMDRSYSVFNSIVAVDNLDRSSQFATSNEVQQRLFNNWRLDEGYHSFLLDRGGKIVALDPDEKTLATIK